VGLGVEANNLSGVSSGVDFFSGVTLGVVTILVFVRDIVLLKELGIRKKKRHIVNFTRVKRTPRQLCIP
jgi:hypothetical protein